MYRKRMPKLRIRGVAEAKALKKQMGKFPYIEMISKEREAWFKEWKVAQLEWAASKNRDDTSSDDGIRYTSPAAKKMNKEYKVLIFRSTVASMRQTWLRSVLVVWSRYRAKLRDGLLVNYYYGMKD